MIAIIDYGMGNLRSVANALDFIGVDNEITSDHERIRAADRLVLPGVGAFGAAMQALEQRGLRRLLEQQVRSEGKLILGICLGMQLFAACSNEGGIHEGLGWIKGDVTRIDSADVNLKVPHIGWNATELRSHSRLFADIPSPGDFYYVHSYAMRCDDVLISAQCDYGTRVVAAVEHGNVLGTQFHPEKSQAQGLAVLRNFVALSA